MLLVPVRIFCRSLAESAPDARVSGIGRTHDGRGRRAVLRLIGCLFSRVRCPVEGLVYFFDPIRY